MDEIVQQLDAALVGPSDKTAQSKYGDMYKSGSDTLGNQEERRQAILEHQKRQTSVSYQRNQNLDRVRGIYELLNTTEDEMNWDNEDKKVHYKPKVYVPGFHHSISYKNILMMSEWLVEKPADFHEKWYIVPCPKGTRTLCVANNGRTKCFSKFGSFLFQCRTALPGGNPIDRKHRSQCCILDGFYQEKNNTFYILDLLVWNQQPMNYGETEFRQFWLESNLKEFSEIRCLTSKNDMIFSLLPKVPCMKEPLNEFLMTYPPFEGNFPQLDGFLFYHKEAHYFSGQTPLVGWLFPYMINEVLGSDVTVNERYRTNKPITYKNQAEFIEKFEAKHSEKVKKKLLEKEQKRIASLNGENTNTEDPNSKSNEDTMEVSQDANKAQEDSMEQELMENGSNNINIAQSKSIPEVSSVFEQDTDNIDIEKLVNVDALVKME